MLRISVNPIGECRLMIANWFFAPRPMAIGDAKTNRQDAKYAWNLQPGIWQVLDKYFSELPFIRLGVLGVSSRLGD